MPKSECNISRGQFRLGAQPIQVIVNGVPLTAIPKEFSTGSLGWYLNGKMTVLIGGVPVKCQIGCNITVVGSKEAE